MTRYLAKNQARLLFGTDTPSAPIYTNPPGLNGLYEMRRWAAAGVSARQLFRAATLENARIMRLDRTIGTIEEGKPAATGESTRERRGVTTERWPESLYHSPHARR